MAEHWRQTKTSDAEFSVLPETFGHTVGTEQALLQSINQDPLMDHMSLILINKHIKVFKKNAIFTNF